MTDHLHKITDETRRSIVDAMIACGNLRGDKKYHDFLKWVYPSANESIIAEVERHMDRFKDWPETYFVDNILKYLSLSDKDFSFFLEQYVNPNLHHKRWNEEEEQIVDIPNEELVALVNKYLSHDGFVLRIKDTIGDKNFYQCVPLNPGVQGRIKNIIFAAKYKPEIVFDDALNNAIRIIKNADQCLIYERSIPSDGVKWDELVAWYAKENNITDNQENMFIQRLFQSLDISNKEQGAESGPETWMLQAYYELKREKGINPPALIPQVYLYYDPQTLKQRGYKLFEHQKMDFLMIFSHRDRVVIEIDGKQHYSEGEKASPKLYADMVKAHREMSLYGYDVYRFGGYEFIGATEEESRKKEVFEFIKEFFIRLFHKYGIEIN